MNKSMSVLVVFEVGLSQFVHSNKSIGRKLRISTYIILAIHQHILGDKVSTLQGKNPHFCVIL